ncbi:MAG: hypothetical protein ACR2J3_12770 [Aridibacter sp.]
MKIYKILFIAIVSVFLINACYSTAPTTKVEETNKTNSVETKTEITEDSKTADAPNAEMNPTETLKAFSKATKSKNAETIKGFLSEGSMKMVEKSAKEQNKTVENILTEGEDETDDGGEPVTRNEKINGNTATVEVKNEVFGRYDEMPFVKEDGVWKIALDKFMDAMVKKINEDQQQAPEPNRK